jgi:hypothetical protein
MALSTRPRPGRGLRLAVAGGVLLTALTAATAAAAPATLMEVSAPERPRLGTAAGAALSSQAGASTRPRTPIPGFLLERGRYTKFDAPGAQLETTPLGINDRGQVVGSYYQTAPFRPPGSKPRGFLLDHGKLTRLDVPGAAGTLAMGINNRGQVVGQYQQPDGTSHGFL